jgi:hypothetical protein
MVPQVFEPFPNPEGIVSVSPGLRAASYPGCPVRGPFTLKGLYPRPRGGWGSRPTWDLARSSYALAMRTERIIAARSARAWNRKNLPSGIEPVTPSPGRQLSEVMQQLPSTAMTLFRRHPAMLVMSLLALSVLGLAWALTRGD